MTEELKIIISAQVENLKRNVQDAQSQIKGFKEQVANASKDVDKNMQSLGGALKNGLATAAKAATTAVASIGAALLGTAALTADYRNEQAKLNTAFEAAGASADAAKQTYNDLYRVLGESDRAVEAANHLAKLTTNEKELAEWTNITQGVYATFGDSLPIEALTEAANETAKVGTVTGTLADALNWAGISEDAFNESLAKCNTEAEREKLIRETLTGLYDDAAKTYEKNNAQMLKQNEAQAKLSENLAKVGAAVQPVITLFSQLASEALAYVTPYIQQISTEYMPKLEPVLRETAEILAKIMQALADNWGIVVTIAGVIAGITAAVGLYNAVAAVKAAMAAAEVTTVWALVSAYAAQAAAMLVAIAPYALIVAAIAAVIAIIVVCVKHWDDIKAAVSNAVEVMKTKVASAKEKIVSTFEAIKKGIGDKIEGAKTKVKNAIDQIKQFFSFKWELPKIETPKITITWETKGVLAEAAKFIGLKGLPKFNVAWNALGGVFDKPKLVNYGGSLQGIGENGAEAVVPLEKNTQWLDRLATMLNEKQGTRPIIMQVDGKTFAQVSVDSINALTKQTGVLPLRIV